MQNMLERQIGNYRITAEIAAGTFGSVYMAKHLVFDDEPVVAVKLLHTHLGSEKERERFFQEARFLRKLRHPSILPLLDAGVYEGFLFLIVEYASNGSLHDRLRRQPSQSLPIGETLVILSQIVQALQHAHDQNIVHRDLKPANILFNTKGEAVLADFGIAVVLEHTKRVEVEGTPPYMAPEQFQGEVSKRSDQYALGCIAYELFTGQRPFIAPDFFSMGYKHVHEQPTPPTQLNPNLPGYMEQAILKAMSKQREDRYSDVAAFLAALQRLPEPTVIEKPLVSPKSQKDWLAALQRLPEPTVIEKPLVSPKSQKDWLKEGDIFRDHEQYQEAIGAYEEAIRLDPNDAQAHNSKGVVLSELKRYKEALETCERAIKLDPNNALAHNTKGSALYRLGRYKEALEACEQAIRLDLNFAQAHNNKGSVLCNLGRYEEAIKAYEEAIRLDPNFAQAHNNKGAALYNLGRYEEAIKAYEEAIKLDPNNALAHNTKGSALYWLGRYKEALETCEQAIKLDPNNAQAHKNKGNALSGLGCYEEAIKACEAAIRLDPNYAAAHSTKGSALYGLGRYKEAIEAYEEAIRLDPSNAVFHNNKGYTLGKLGRYKEAVEAYEEAIRLDPNFAQARNNKDVVLKKLKNAL